LRIEGVRVRRFGDKAVSAGEHSLVEAHDLHIADGRIGVASKDRSTVELRDVVMDGLDIGLAAFMKKSEYGPAEMHIDGVDMNNVVRPVLVQNGSRVVLDRKLQPSEEFDPGVVIYAGHPVAGSK
jgi:hypothetical protein